MDPVLTEDDRQRETESLQFVKGAQQFQGL